MSFISNEFYVNEQTTLVKQILCIKGEISFTSNHSSGIEYIKQWTKAYNIHLQIELYS